MLKFLVLSILISGTLAESRLREVTVRVPVVPFNPNAEIIDIDGRVSGGYGATDTQFPFINEVNRYETSTAYYSCTGSFLTTSWVLTALHCLRP